MAGHPNAGVRGRCPGHRGGHDRVRLAAGREPGPDPGRVTTAPLAEHDGEHPGGEQEYGHQRRQPDRKFRGGLTAVVASTVVADVGSGPWSPGRAEDTTGGAAQNDPARARCTSEATAERAAELVTAA